ncbi:hypothetical protein [Pedomonas mirosovicensis]|uniref:hypothetical protein n=1 Tax=Pedomonas mirosovicensis TaxID=2908641 RepID=UPI002166C5C9|nr:hypothetical protein [Pedomonas mirosovicensis]MCH8684250.1 hypothetical protein [Pedomonas mirosovicensis]
MDWQITVGALVAVAALTLWANIASRRPRKLGRVPLIPPDVIQLIGLIALFVLGAHLISLIRGAPLPPRQF